MKKMFSTLAMIAIAGIVNAQIVYTDLTANPVRINGTNSEYSLNLMGGTEEFMFQNYAAYGEAVYFASMTAGAAVVSTAADYNANVDALAAGTSIGPSSTFHGFDEAGTPYFTILYLPDTYTFGTSSSSDYIGFRFTNGSNTHYGWAQVKMTVSGTNVEVVLYGYAYQSSPNTAIAAGDKGQQALITSCSDADLRLYPSPATNHLAITGSLPIMKAEILNLLGQPIMETVQTDNIDLSTLPRGTYVVRIQTPSGILTRRFIKQ